MQRIAAHGVTLAVKDEGAGPAVLLLHGFPDSSRLWRYQVPVLIDHGRPQSRCAGCRADPLRRRTVAVDRQLEPAQIRGRAEVVEQEVLEAELAEQFVEQAPDATS